MSQGFFPPLARRPAQAGLYQEADHAQRLPSIFGGVGTGWLGSLAGFLSDLGRIPVPYTLEVREGGQIVAAVALPLAPSQVAYVRPGATEVVYTFGAEPYREHTAHRRLDVSLSGVSGLAARPGNNRYGEIIFAPGPQLVRELDAFLDLYQRQAAEAARRRLADPDKLLSGALISASDELTFTETELYGTPSAGGEHEASEAGVVLVFRSLLDKVHLRVEVAPRGWQVRSETGDSRLTSKWALDLHGYAAAEPSEPRNFLGYIADAALYVATLIGGVNNVLAATDTILGNVRGDLEVLRAPALALQGTARLIGSTAGRVGDLAAFPRTLVADWVAVGAAFGSAVGQWEASGGALSQAFDPSSLAITRSTQDAQRAALLGRPALGALGGGSANVDAAILRREQGLALDLGGSQTGPDQSASQVLGQGAGGRRGGGVPQSSAQSGPGDLVYTWAAGDTLAGIAGRFGVGLRALVLANGIRNGSRGDGVPLGPGVSLVVPGVLQGLNAASGAGRFGVDLRLSVDGGDLLLVDTGRGGDLGLVSGGALVEQALEVRFATMQGEVRAFRGYGLPVTVGDPSSSLVAGYLAVHAREQAMRDPRVGQVQGLDVIDGGDSVAVRLDVLTREGAQVDVLAAAARA